MPASCGTWDCTEWGVVHCQKQAGRATSWGNGLAKSTKAKDLSMEAHSLVGHASWDMPVSHACVTKVSSSRGCPNANMVDTLTATPCSSRMSQC